MRGADAPWPKQRRRGGPWRFHRPQPPPPRRVKSLAAETAALKSCPTSSGHRPISIVRGWRRTGETRAKPPLTGHEAAATFGVKPRRVAMRSHADGGNRTLTDPRVMGLHALLSPYRRSMGTRADNTVLQRTREDKENRPTPHHSPHQSGRVFSGETPPERGRGTPSGSWWPPVLYPE